MIRAPANSISCIQGDEISLKVEVEGIPLEYILMSRRDPKAVDSHTMRSRLGRDSRAWTKDPTGERTLLLLSSPGLSSSASQ